ncbi:Flp pilus assembly protein CpaB [Arthrobacter sp. 2YAF22_2]|uniref:Flp pilus assembly protein CpaB n=1 Tax=Arthrobacter sp. 2YAF22_2 TaxID=3233029 RepID=UPI003F93BEFD
MKSRLLAGIAAVVLAIIGAVLVVSYAHGADERAVKDLDPVDVLVVAKAVPAGTAVESLLPFLAAQKLPGTAVAKSALHSLDGQAGKVTAVELLPGEQLVAERLTAPETAQSSGAVQVPDGLQEISFQLDPQRVVGGRLAAGDHIGIFISLKNGGLEAKPDKETTQLTLHKVLVTAVQRAPAATPSPQPSPGASGAPPEDTSLPTGALLLTVAVNDVDATRIVYGSEFGTLWLSKEPLNAKDSGRPGIMTKPEVYK